jgi:cyclohexanecarboxylate-CoA ligase
MVSLLEQDINWRERGWHGDETLIEACAAASRVRGDVVVRFVSEDGNAVLTVGDLHRNSLGVAGGLASAGVGLGDAVLCQLPSWAETAMLFQAAAALGAVFVPVVPTASPNELADLVRRCNARVVVTAAAWRGRSREAHLDALGESSVDHLIIVGDGGPPGSLSWDDVASNDPVSELRSDPDSTRCIIFTSGSTGIPKGVRHSDNTLLAEVRGPAGDPVVPDANLRLLSVLPPGHIADLLTTLRIAVSGLPAVVLDRWDAAAAATLIEEHGITSISLTPHHLQGLLEERGERDTSTLTNVLVGAAGVSPALVRAADQRGWPALRCFGATEHPSVSASLPTDPLEDRADTDGRPLVGNEVRIVGSDGCDVPAGEEGEVWTRGPERCLGYLDAVDEHDVFLHGGWYRSGDIGRLGQRGHLTITDRLKDIIIRGGENIAAKEVEDALGSHPAVAEVAVVAMPDPAFGERVCAFVVLRQGSSTDLNSLVSHGLAAGLSAQKCPERMLKVDALPRTAAGKVQKNLLRAQMARES